MKSGDFPGLQNQWLGDPERWVRFPSASANDCRDLLHSPAVSEEVDSQRTDTDAFSLCGMEYAHFTVQEALLRKKSNSRDEAMKRVTLALLLVVLAPITANAVPVLYDFNFDLGADGVVTGQFVADLDAQNDTNVAAFGFVNTNVFEFNFLGVTFDIGTANVRRAAGFTDFTGVGGSFTSSGTPGATLILNTCGFIQCVAQWSIPGVDAGSFSGLRPGSVTRAVVAPEPGSLFLLSLGLLGLGVARTRRKV